MRLIFCGTSPFSAAILESLIAKGHEIALVLTQPDRPAGRGMKLTETPVKVCAKAHQLRVLTPTTLKDDEILNTIKELNSDAAVVVAYGLLLPKTFLDIPRLGCLNIHASLLPRWRGAAPIHRAIMAGDRMTGISIMKMDEGLDTGPVYEKIPVPIDLTDTTAKLERKLLETAIDAIDDVLQALERTPEMPAIPQLAVQATYAAKIDKEEAMIDWQQDAQSIDRLIRGLNPAPGAKTTLNGQIIKIYLATPVDIQHQAKAGEILEVTDNALLVACQTGALSLRELQKANAKRMDVAQFLRGMNLMAGQRLG